MNLLRKALASLGGVVVIALVVSLAAPQAVHAVVAALVQVSNTPTTAVPTLAAPAASQLYSGACESSSPPTSAGANCSFPAVPAGQTLFIETISISSQTSPGADPSLAFINTDSNTIYIPMVKQANFLGGLDSFVGTLAGRVAVKTGATPACQIGLSNVSNAGGMQCTITGYLAPAE